MTEIIHTTLGYTKIVCYKNKIYYKFITNLLQLYNFFSLCKILNMTRIIHIIHAYVHMYIHTDIHTYVQTYHTYIRTDVHILYILRTYIHTTYYITYTNVFY